MLLLRYTEVVEAFAQRAREAGTATLLFRPLGWRKGQRAVVAAAPSFKSGVEGRYNYVQVLRVVSVDRDGHPMHANVVAPEAALLDWWEPCSPQEVMEGR